MTKNERFALGNFTCDYPEDIGYEEVLVLIEKDSDKVLIWEPFENDYPPSIAEKINDHLHNLDREYPEGKREEAIGGSLG